MNPGSQIGQEAIANMEIEMMTDLYNRWAGMLHLSMRRSTYCIHCRSLLYMSLLATHVGGHKGLL